MNNEENLFPEENKETEAEKNSADTAAESGIGVKTPWLDFMEKYPQFRAEDLPEGMAKAVSEGENPTECYLRLENERLRENLRLLKEEKLLRSTCIGSVKSAGDEEEADEFVLGLFGND